MANGPGSNNEWVAGSGTLGLTDATNLPARGMIIVHNKGAGLDENHTYEYQQHRRQHADAGDAAGVAAYPNDNVACMVPLVQTTVHQDAPTLTASPRTGDAVRLYEHAKLSNNAGGYDSWGHPGGAPVYYDATVAEVGTMTDPTDPAHPLAQYTWVGFDPDLYTFAGATGNQLFTASGADIGYAGETGFLDPMTRRWKVLNTAAGTLSGELPCYPAHDAAHRRPGVRWLRRELRRRSG